MTRRQWGPILTRAADIVRSYDTGVTLRQLFYRLVAAQILPNTTTCYKQLSERTATARRAGRFPDLIDNTRYIHRDRTFQGAEDAHQWLIDTYQRDRTEGQPWSIYLGVEKHGITEQLYSWFGDYGIPILSLGGYSSQSYVKNVMADVVRVDRPAVLVYAGDFDASGEDIDRDFIARTGCWDEVVRVALTREQVVAYQLPPQPGKSRDPRAAGFVARHGGLVQVELDALDPDVLRGLYSDAITDYMDASIFQESVDMETADREALIQNWGR